MVYYATIASPLQDLTKKDIEFLWVEEAQRSFEALKLAQVGCTDCTSWSVGGWYDDER